MTEPADDQRVPVLVLTGFLGAGKTTLLNRLLRDPSMSRTAVLINEFGEVAVDHHLVDKVDDSIVVLDSGCICCSVQGDLLRALKDVFQRGVRRENEPVERVLIETTGLADPAPIIHTLMQDFFVSARFRCDGVITAVDVTHAPTQLDTHREAVRQVAMADRLLLTKCDLADAPARATVVERLRVFNPGAPLVEVFGGAVGTEALDACGIYDPGSKSPDVAVWLGEEAARARAERTPATAGPTAWRRPGTAPATRRPARHDADVQSFVLTFDQPLDWFGFSEGLSLLLQVYGDRLLRIKGLLNISGDPLPRIVQCVQHAAYPPASLPAWPESGPYADRRSKLVFIAHGLPQGEVESILGSFCGQAPATSDR
ncbi:MAG: GTP-binding protein [Rhodocyclaceae bacterium]|nr:GTP-binding protein [Rhodocyclaceae bacterium]